MKQSIEQHQNAIRHEYKGKEQSMHFDLSSIGESLRIAREGKGLTIDQVSEKLFLRKSIIVSLESGDWEHLPHRVYVKGYLSQYAVFLGIEEELSDLMAKDSGGLETEEAPRPLLPPPADKRPAKLTLSRLAVYGSAAALLVIFFLLQNFPVREISVEIPEPSRQLEPISKSAYDSPGESPISDTGKKLLIACSEKTWIRIVIDGSEKKELMLLPQDIVMFTCKQNFDLLIGNAGGVKLFYNGSDTGFSGEMGEVKRVNLPSA